MYQQFFIWNLLSAIYQDFFYVNSGVDTYTQKRICVHIWTKNMGRFYHNSDGFMMLCFKTSA